MQKTHLPSLSKASMKVSLIHPMMKVTNPDCSDLVLLMRQRVLLGEVIRRLLLIMVVTVRHILLRVHHHLLLLHHNHGSRRVLHGHPLLLLLILSPLLLSLLLLLLIRIQIGPVGLLSSHGRFTLLASLPLSLFSLSPSFYFWVCENMEPSVSPRESFGRRELAKLGERERERDWWA